MSTNEVIKHSRRVFGLLKKDNLKPGHKLGEILTEIAIIVFAISLSLVLERWRQNQDDQKLEKKFLAGLKTDLTHDLEELKGSSAKCISMKNAAKYFLRPENGIDWSSDSTKYYSYKLFHNVYFFPNTNRYESLKSSGKLDVIEDEALQNTIIDLYQTKIPDLGQQINFFNQFLNTQVKDYLIHNFKRDTNNQVVLDRSFFTQPGIKNILSFYTDLDDVLKRANASLDESEVVLKKIDSLLKK
ncbi:hypothetical protein [Mucilaginibacter lappiensis]|jgi:type II secretory pathway pseudopilin PulG|uniref:hypothetical protein n=1 Tax=Mucilaginibacter lappiensis TaxID=354630 RepID=UPI003D1EBC28